MPQLTQLFIFPFGGRQIFFYFYQNIQLAWIFDPLRNSYQICSFVLYSIPSPANPTCQSPTFVLLNTFSRCGIDVGVQVCVCFCFCEVSVSGSVCERVRGMLAQQCCSLFFLPPYILAQSIIKINENLITAVLHIYYYSILTKIKNNIPLFQQIMSTTISSIFCTTPTRPCLALLVD